jgi:hypothetical protein
MMGKSQIFFFTNTLSRVFWGFIVGSLLVLGCGRSPSDSEVKSAMEPHRPQKGPWFEGWYARTVDLGGKRSVAVIVGSYVGQGVQPTVGQTFPGYIGILASEGDGQPTRSWTAFPKESRATINGAPVTDDPQILRREDDPFSWEAEGFGSVQNRHLELSIPGQVEVSMEMDEGTSWDQTGLPLGPEGIGSGLPLPLHWYVGSLSSSTRYRIKWWEADGSTQELSGESLTHLEKNWGAAFPKAWNWLQGLSVDGDAQMVLGGGTLSIVGVDIKAWLAGYRSPKESWDLRFSDPAVSIDVTENSCQGQFHLKAKRLDLEVEIKAQAPLGSFGPVAVPTSQGFVANLGIESFSSTTEVWTYRPGLFGRRLTDHRIFQNAALEFGAGSYRPECRLKL